MKIGLLPLYIALYDKISPNMRPRLERFYASVAAAFEERGVSVVRSAFCRLAPEFGKAVASFEAAGADAIVTLHMAYSPSLESIESLVSSPLPVVVLDTTDTLAFTPMQDPDDISYCHGIHGVMDMCSMLKRYGKPYAIAAGHFPSSDCIDRAIGFVRAGVAASALKKAKVGLIGGAFFGMGDFAVSPSELYETFGIRLSNVAPEDLAAVADTVTDAEIDAEIEEDKKRYRLSDKVVYTDYAASVRAGLAVRRYIEKEKLTAFSVNFLQIGRNACGIESIPFIEACKAMERGIGYAGEGDGLTAAFTGALLTGYPDTSFVEIFCPDWKNNAVFLSHMGEVNYRIAATVPTVQPTAGNLTDGVQPYAGYVRYRGGKGAYVNVSRGKDGYQLLIAPAEMLDAEKDNFPNSMRGWMRAETPSTADFLRALSENGATHHSSFVYGTTAEEMAFFGKILHMDTVII